MYQKLLSVCGLLLCCGLLSSCLGDEDEFNPLEQFEKEQAAIDEYIAKNAIDAQSDPLHDLRYAISEPGSGLSPKDTSVVTVSYTGRLLSNGRVFDQGDSASFMLGGLVEGWRVLLPLLKEGGSMTMFIPSYYGYGQHNLDSIPPNSTLIFDVTLHKVETLFEYEQRIIDEHLAAEGLTAEIDSTHSLRYIITEPGSEIKPDSSSRINVDYKGMFLGTGNEFGSGEDVNLTLSRLIKGWPVLMPYIGEGGKIVMYLPSKYAYGRSGAGQRGQSGYIPPNSTLIFEVTLNEVLED